MNYSFKDFYRDAMDVVLLNLIFLGVILLGAFITFGAAFKALFYVSFRIIDPKKPNYVFKSFIKSFKEGFLLSTINWLIAATIGFLLFIIFKYSIDNNQTILLISCFVTFYLLVIYLLYLYPMMAIFKTESTKQLLKNTFILAGCNFFTSLKLMLSLVFVIGLFLLFHGTILFSIGLFGILIVFHLKKVFMPYLKQYEFDDSED
ncbi:MAG: YesL family protein [Bacilli bacterium]|nr:YesL family protein [Bacilli bacterium]MDD4077719.1 YesL family protein [Bacilli bacterium]